MSKQRLFAIGDLHGCVDELEVLLEEIEPGAQDILVFLGDYIDRGAESRQVISRLIALSRKPCKTVFLKGNHEDMFLSFLGREGDFRDAFLYNGGEATLISYGINSRADKATPQIPQEHLRFLLDLQLTYIWENFLFVHAGIRPGVPLSDQKEHDFLWIRDEFSLSRHQMPYTVVFGHTAQRKPLVNLPYKIGIDTGLVYGNKLTCFEATADRFLQVQRGGLTVVTMPLETPAVRKSPA